MGHRQPPVPGRRPQRLDVHADQQREHGKWKEFVVVLMVFRHQLLLPRPYLVLTKPLRLDIQCQRAASVKIGWKYLDD